jgi:hypothetical protein
MPGGLETRRAFCVLAFLFPSAKRTAMKSKKSFFENLRAVFSPGKTAAEKLAEARAECARLGIVLDGKYSPVQNATEVSVTSGNMGFSVEETSLPAALSMAESVSVSDDSAMIKRVESRNEFGVEFFSAKKDEFGIARAVPYYTDSRGIVLPTVEVQARQFSGVPGKVWERAIPAEHKRPEKKAVCVNPFAPREVAVDENTRIGAETFARMCAKSDGRPVDTAALLAKIVEQDMLRASLNRGKAANILCARPSAPECAPVVEPAQELPAPTKIVTFADRCAFLRRSQKAAKKFSPEVAEKIAASERKCADLAAQVSALSSEYRAIQPGTLLRKANGKTEFSEEKIERLKEQARELRVLLSWEKETLTELRSGR